MFFDGHAKWISRGQWLQNPCGEPVSGVYLMRLYPLPGVLPGQKPWSPECPN
jgi:hypothetical protein